MTGLDHPAYKLESLEKKIKETYTQPKQDTVPRRMIGPMQAYQM